MKNTLIFKTDLCFIALLIHWPSLKFIIYIFAYIFDKVMYWKLKRM